MADPVFVEQMTKLAFDLRPRRGADVQPGIDAVKKEKEGLMPELVAILNLN